MLPDKIKTLQFRIDKEHVYRKTLEYELAILSRYVVNKEKYESLKLGCGPLGRV